MYEGWMKENGYEVTIDVEQVEDDVRAALNIVDENSAAVNLVIDVLRLTYGTILENKEDLIREITYYAGVLDRE